MKRCTPMGRGSCSSTRQFSISPILLLITLFSCLSFSAMAQKTISGRVFAGDSVLAGASVEVKGTTVGTTTDPQGRYTLEVPANATLVVNYVGFTPQEIRVGSQSSIDVVLMSATAALDDVVVVGYGTQKKSTLTGSVSTVDGAEIAKVPSPNVISSMQGRLPGLIANQRSGNPGRDDPNILIRGAASFPVGTSNGEILSLNAPLIIVDGVPRDNLSRINPQDIESVSVLKDGSAAIYGARAANGVILVTTKVGARGKADFSLSYNYGISNPTKVVDVLDAPTFAEVYNEGVFYRARRDSANFTPQYKPEQIQKMRDGSDPNLNPNTDWVGLLLHSSYVKNLNFSVNGGSQNVRYLLSFGNLQQNGNFYGNTMKYDQYNMRAKVDITLVKDLVVGANISAIIKNGDYPGGGNNGNIDWFNILGANPTIVGRYPNGLPGPGRLNLNPLLNDDRGYFKSSDVPIYSTFTAAYSVPFVKGLKINSSFNYDLRNQFTKNWTVPYSFYEYNPNTDDYVKRQAPGLTNANLTDRYDKWTTMLTNVRLEYDRTFDAHHIGAMVGWEQQNNTFSYASGTRRNFLSPAIAQLNLGSTSADDQGVGGSANLDAFNNYFGRVNYDFKSKYLLEFLFRYDGSQIFPEDNRYGFFPAASVGWRLSEEDFFKSALPFVNQLKIRATYGELGNNRIPGFYYLESFLLGQNYTFGSTVAPGIYTRGLANPNIAWEKAKKTDFGLEAQLWNGKLGIDFTYWLQKRNNILYQPVLSVPTTFGFPPFPRENLGKSESHGIELVLSTRGYAGKFDYNISGNVAYNRSKIIYLDEVPPAEDYMKITGSAIGSDLYFKTDGIFNTQKELDEYPHYPNSQVGDLKIVDLNGDGEVNANDRYRNELTVVPRWVFGLNSNFSYRGFDLTIFFQGQAGVRNYDNNAAALGGTDFTNASVWRAEDRWSPTNPNGTKPRADAWQPGNTDFFLFDATFVRLKTVEIGYNIPESVLGYTKFLKSLRVYVSGFNVATWAKEIKWADPELNGGYFTYPVSRIINFGASVKF